MAKAATNKVAPKKMESAKNIGDAATIEVAAVTTNKQTYRVKREFPPNTIVPVVNGFHGVLVYQSPRTHERFQWEDFGAEQDMELQELKIARNSFKKFFENNWFLINDPEVIDYLGVGQYYKNALTLDDFDSLFEMNPEDVKAKVDSLSEGQRLTLKYRAKQLIEDGVIDSIKVITALEKSLGVELIER